MHCPLTQPQLDPTDGQSLAMQVDETPSCELQISAEQPPTRQSWSLLHAFWYDVPSTRA